ncbi:MAG: hypothetical protein ACE5EC_06225, partial [Phycisphaerae bacterium]
RLPFVLMYCPLAYQLGPDAKFRQAQYRLAEWALRRDVPYLDLTPTFERELDRTGCGVRDLMMDTVHPTAAGAGVIADAIIQMTATKRLVPGLTNGPS